MMSCIWYSSVVLERNLKHDVIGQQQNKMSLHNPDGKFATINGSNSLPFLFFNKKLHIKLKCDVIEGICNRPYANDVI